MAQILTQTMTTARHPAPDAEVGALNTIITTLGSLTEDQRRNVLLYVNARFGGVLRGRAQGNMGARSVGEEDVATDAPEYADLGALFDATNPQSEADRVLVVAYWKQVIEGATSFEAFPVSKELKHLGHGVSNITRALDALIKQSPKLVLQVAKSGRSQQARKRYKLTREGIRRVRAMVNATDEGENRVN